MEKRGGTLCNAKLLPRPDRRCGIAEATCAAIPHLDKHQLGIVAHDQVDFSAADAEISGDH